MPDFAMCPGGSCPMRSECWRHKAEPGIRQAYLIEPPFRVMQVSEWSAATVTTCEMLIPMRKP